MLLKSSGILTAAGSMPVVAEYMSPASYPGTAAILPAIARMPAATFPVVPGLPPFCLSPYLASVILVTRMRYLSDIPADMFLQAGACFFYYQNIIASFVFVPVGNKERFVRYYFFMKSYDGGEERSTGRRPGWLYDRYRSAPVLILTIFSFVLHYAIFSLPVIRTDRKALKYTDNIQHSLPFIPFIQGIFFTENIFVDDIFLVKKFWC